MPPLFCVPILVKDNFDVLGMATTAGLNSSSPILSLHSGLCMQSHDRLNQSVSKECKSSHQARASRISELVNLLTSGTGSISLVDNFPAEDSNQVCCVCS